jgi:acetoin utilization deacetylase AcuC-like enzyme
MALKVGIVRDERYLEHQTGVIHPEHPNRLKYLYRMLDGEFSGKFVSVEPEPVTLEYLELVHTPAYVKKVMQTAGRDFTHLAGDTPSGPNSYLAAWLAAGGCLKSLEELLSGNCEVCFALVRPPGHHALPDRAGGFCIFDNLGIAARYAIKIRGLKRILILDWDIHHGNAIQDLFYAEKEVLYISSHFINIYPYSGQWDETGEGEGEGYNINLIWQKGVDDLDITKVYEEVVGGAVRRYRPELIMVAAGFDLHNKDIFSRARITENAFGRLTKMLLQLRAEVDCPPILLALEGGYRIPALVSSVRQVLCALTESQDLGEVTEGSGDQAGEVLERAEQIHAPYGVWTD